MTDDLKRKSKEISDHKRENKRLKWKWKLGSWNGKAFYMESIWKMENSIWILPLESRYHHIGQGPNYAKQSCI